MAFDSTTGLAGNLSLVGGANGTNGLFVGCPPDLIARGTFVGSFTD